MESRTNKYRKDGYITGVPEGTFQYVLDFCQSITSHKDPVYVPIKPEPGALMNECFSNVNDAVQKNGGKRVLGWQIWEMYGLMIEAEFHVVWLTKDNEFIDVTPKVSPFERILFLEDTSLVYEDVQVNNVRKSLIRKTGFVDDFIAIRDRYFEIMNKGDRLRERNIRKLNFSPEEAEELEVISMRSASLIDVLIQSTPERNEFCRCGSGKKWKKCHGK